MTPTKAKNSFGIPFLRTGPRGLVSVLNQILAALDAVRVVQGGEVTSAGTIIRPGATTTTTRPRSAAHPFQLSPVAGAAKVTAAYGTVTGYGVNLVPTIGGVSIAALPAPELTVVTGTVYLKATVDAAGTPTALVIENAATTPTDTETEKHREITAVTVATVEGVSNVTVTSPQSVQTALNFFLCEGSAIWERA